MTAAEVAVVVVVDTSLGGTSLLPFFDERVSASFVRCFFGGGCCCCPVFEAGDEEVEDGDDVDNIGVFALLLRTRGVDSIRYENFMGSEAAQE